MKKIIYIVTILALLLQPGISFFPGASAQEGGGEPLAPTYPIHYVKPLASGAGNCDSWANACGLKPALSAAAPGDEIWVQQGTYKPDFWENLTDFTFVTWVYWRGGAYCQRIFDFGGDANNRIDLSPQCANSAMTFEAKRNGISQIFTTPTYLPPNTWFHVAFTLSGNIGTIYLNGLQIASSSTITYEPKDIAFDNILLGRGQYYLDPYFYGVIDEVALFNRALSQPEIAAVYGSGWDATPGKVLALHLEENPASDGTTLLDSFEAGYGGTLKTDNGSANKSVAGHVGQAISLDGIGDYVALRTRRQGTFNLKNGVALYGGFLGTETSRQQRDWVNNLTTLSGDIGVAGSSGDNSLHVVTSNGVDASTILDGFTTSGGNASLTGIPNEWGGGMYVRYSYLTIRNVELRNNSAIGGGGGMFIDGGAPALVDVVFRQNTSTHNGGGLHTLAGAIPTLTNVAFSENHAGENGGGLHNYGTSPELTNVTFSNNSADHWGGGMYNRESANPALSGVTFNGNTATNGGGMYNTGLSNPSLANVTFSSNTATNSGGGMYNYTSSPSITETLFSSNTASSYGGGMYNYDSSPRLTGINFTSNTATGGGGGMFNTDNSSPRLTNATFSSNVSVYGGGGGLHNEINSNPSLTEVTISNNTAQVGGGMQNYQSSPSLTGVTFLSNHGAGMVNEESNPILSNVHFEENYDGSQVDGGGMSNYSSSPSLTDVDFISNHALYAGGGMSNRENSNPLLMDVTFRANDAGYYGGGMRNSNSNPSLTNVTFNGNDAGQRGGGMYNSGSSPVITATQFITNTAQLGGGMYSANESRPVLVVATFSGNQATTGGGMYNENSAPQITQSGFYTNTAVTSGGGVYNLSCSTQNPQTLVNVLFNANRATGTSGQGGGLYNDNCPAELTNVTFVHNQAVLYGGGIYATGALPPTLRNSLLWGNTASGTTPDNQFHPYPPSMFFNTTIQAIQSDPSPFVDADGLDNTPGTLDDDLHPTYPSTYSNGAVIDGGVEASLPSDTHDLDHDGITSEKLPVDFDGHPRIYADNNLDGMCDGVSYLETDTLEQVDRGAYEAGCWAWHMQIGNGYLVEGRDYRLGFHAEIDEPSTVTIGQTLSAYTLERTLVALENARKSFGIAIECAATVTQTRQATLGMLDAIWEQATGAMLEGNEMMVQVLDVTGSGASDNELSELQDARSLYDKAVRGYLEPLASGDYPGLLETIEVSRTHAITGTATTSLVDLERLLKASAGKSRAVLELAERQLRDGQKTQAEQTLRGGYFQALAEMALLYSLWPEVADTVDYTALLRNLGDMDRLYGYIVSDKNPLGYDSDFIPFSFDYEHPNANNYLQTWYIAGRDLDAAETAVTAAAGKQQEVDDDYSEIQRRRNDDNQYYNSILVGLCGTAGGLPDREHCAGGDIQEQEQVVENAMLQIERVIQQMENQNALIRIEQERVATEAGIRYATARLITSTGEELATQASQQVMTELYKDTTEGVFGVVNGFLNGAFSGARAGGSNPYLTVGLGLIGGILGGVTSGMEWQSQNQQATDLADIAAAKERLYAKQQAVVQYAEGDIASANSLALQRQYMLKFAELDIDLAIAMNNLEKELAHMVNLRDQAEYALAEQAKAQAFTTLLYQDPAGRIVRERYMELAHYRYERTLDAAFKTGKALAYETNEDVTYTGLPLTSLDDIYPLQDVNLLGNALEQMDDAYTDWLSVVHAPDEDTYNYIYLSLAVGFDDDPTSTREEKFNAFIRDPDQRVDTDHDGCPEVKFTFHTSIQTGNKLGLYTTVFNDKIKSLQMRVYGTDLFYGDERQSIPGIRLKQAGTSMLRTRFSQIPSGGADDLSFYNLDPWNITLQAAANDNPLPSASAGLASRSLAATEWTVNIEGGAGPACGDLNLDHIEDIRLYIAHEYYPLQTGLASQQQTEGPAIREYKPIRRRLPSQSLASVIVEAGNLSPTSPSADNDLNGLFVGTLAITQPVYLPPVELSILLSDGAGNLSGVISPTLTFPIVPGSGYGPALSGSWSGSSFSLASQPFVSDLIQGIPITRTLQFQEGIITSTAITRTLSGAYIETLEGLTPEPLEMRGVFRLERPLRPLQAGFGASPRSVYVGDNVFFNDGSLGNPVSWSWSFGDGGTSTAQNPVHVYAAPGEYTVSLTIGDGFGTHTHTETGFISVMSPSAAPQASFTANPLSGAVPLQVSFQDHSYGGPTSWQWSFGDGGTSTQRNPTHIYTQVGVFDVSLTVTNLFGSDTHTWVDAITTENTKLHLPIVRK